MHDWDSLCVASDKFRTRRPRLWFAIALLPFLFIAFVITPLCVLLDTATDVPRMFKNFWNDLSVTVKSNWKRDFRLVREVWKQSFVNAWKGGNNG